MNYELVKQLKDAGFPFQTHHDVCTLEVDKINGEEYHIPTLSELIEACGLPFALECVDNATKWYAYRTISHNEVNTGDTPEEAVAKLWLELNKPK